jgi:cell division protein FtsN
MAQARKVRRTRSVPVAPTRRPTPGWIWLLVGVFLGLGTAAILYLQGADRPHATALPVSPPSGPDVTGSAPTTPPSPVTPPGNQPDPRFQYFELLPRDEVRVPEVSRPGNNPTAPPATPSTSPSTAERAPAPANPPVVTALARPEILQAGAFRRFAQADELKARLALLGMPSSIQEVQLEDRTVYRVYLGPFHQEAQLRQAMERLRSENIEALRRPAS